MKKVVIDPGHGGTDSGATNGNYKEKDFTLNISLAVRDILRQLYQVDVLMTRSADRTVSLKERTHFANRNNADFFCSIHINAGKGTGWESYIYNGRVPTETVQQRSILHDTVIAAIANTYNVRDRGKKRANFHVLRETTMSAVLLENLFIDTPEDLKLLTDPMFIRDLAHSIAIGIGKALQLSNK